jgi:hypothetical protein
MAHTAQKTLATALFFLGAAIVSAAQSGQSQYCQQAEEKWKDATLETHLAFFQLQTDREVVEELNDSWDELRAKAYSGATVNLAFMAGSMLSKPIAMSMGATEVAQQGIQTKLIDAVLTGIVKAGMKQYGEIYLTDKVDLGEVLKEMAHEGKEEAGIKASEEALASYFERRIEEAAESGQMGPIDRLWTYGVSGADQSALGNSHYLKEYCEGVATKVALLVTAGIAMQDAYTNQTKLEDIRLALKVAREQEARREAVWEQKKDDLEVATYAHEQCEKLKEPGRVESGQPESWAGAWMCGDDMAINVNQTGDSLIFGWQKHFGNQPLSQQSDLGQGGCHLVSANTAKCTYRGSYHDSDKDMVNRHGTLELTLSGDSIDCTTTEDGETPVWRVSPYDSAIHPGAVWHCTWHRKK